MNKNHVPVTTGTFKEHSHAHHLETVIRQPGAHLS